MCLKQLTLINKSNRHLLTVDAQGDAVTVTLDEHTVVLNSKDTEWLIYALQNVREQ